MNQEYKQRFEKLHHTPIRNDSLYFYYDESGNERAFRFRNGAYNCNPLTYFTLGGIAYNKPIENEDLNELFKLLTLQDTVKEIKAKYIIKKNKGQEINKFASEKLYIFLNYIYEKGYYIHYNILDLFYFGVVVDIVESLTMHKQNINQRYSDALKDCLYMCMRQKMNFWESFLSEIGFPNLDDSSRLEFLDVLEKEVYSFFDSKYLLEREELLYLIKEAKLNNYELIFIQNNINELIHRFCFIYRHPILIHDTSYHIFDNEDEIQKTIDAYVDNATNFKFIDSKKSLAVQVSDVCVSIIRTLYNFLSTNTIEDLERYFLDKNGDHRIICFNLKLLANIIIRSVDYSEYLILQSINSNEIEKYNFYLNFFG